MAFDCGQLVHAYMYPEMVFCASVAEAAQPALSSEEAHELTSASIDPTAKKRKRRHGTKNRRGKDSSNNTESIVDENKNANALAKDPTSCNQIIAQLASQGHAARSAFQVVLPIAKTLSFAKHGCRVIQKAVEVGQKDEQADLVEELKGSIIELYKSPHGNHVIAKMIECLPVSSLQFILDEVQGSMIELAKHQYGCRLAERLLEYCPDAQPLKELLLEAEPLCRHAYGNFVIQHIFVHGSQEWKDQIAEQLVGVLPQLAKHRTASHVVQSALERGGDEIQRSFAAALVNAEGGDSLVEVACTRYGSFVVEELSGVQHYREQVHGLLQNDFARLAEDQFGEKVLAKFGLVSAL